MSASRIAIIDGHPDPDPAHFVHALTKAYEDAATAAGREVRRTTIAEIDFPLLRNPSDWLEGEPPAAIAAAQQDVAWAEHVVIVYPLWLGDVPALLKGFLEQLLRPGFAFQYRDVGFPEKLMEGRSARVVVTMGMPALFYRWFYSAHSLKSLERNILKFVGFSPVDHTVFGTIEKPESREKALEQMGGFGAKGE